MRYNPTLNSLSAKRGEVHRAGREGAPDVRDAVESSETSFTVGMALAFLNRLRSVLHGIE
jgi:hypothetical protein